MWYIKFVFRGFREALETFPKRRNAVVEQRRRNTVNVPIFGDPFLLRHRVTSSLHSFGRRVVDASRPFVRGGQRLGRLYPDVRVPFSRGEDDDLIQELFDACQQVLSVLRFVGDVMEDLPGKRQ